MGGFAIFHNLHEITDESAIEYMNKVIKGQNVFLANGEKTRERIAATSDIWVAQWYPKNRQVYRQVVAATLEELKDWFIERRIDHDNTAQT